MPVDDRLPFLIVSAAKRRQQVVNHDKRPAMNYEGTRVDATTVVAKPKSSSSSSSAWSLGMVNRTSERASIELNHSENLKCS